MAFIGFEEDFEQYKKEQATNVAEDSVHDINIIAYNSIDPISDEELLLLLNTRNRHDASKIYLQSDVSFYDEYYNNETVENDPFMEEVRSIRRLYKNIYDYEQACYIRGVYIQQLIEKYGGPELFDIKYRSGSLPEWIPPSPILSDKAPYYTEYINGIEIPEDADDETIARMNQAFSDVLAQRAYEDIVIRGDVELRRNVVSMIDELTSENQSIRRSHNSNINGVSVNDLYNLQQMFDSWYNEDKKKETADLTNVKFFSNTDSRRRSDYFLESPIDSEPGVFMKYVKDPSYAPEYIPENMNEMTVDPKTNLPMTKGELRKRELIREMGESGWDTVKLMRRLSVGSDYEIKLAKRKNQRNKKARKKAQSIMSDIIGTENTSLVSSLDSLQDLLFD